ncbi:hypothetical protein DICVIV_10634 [Dictyocaulus viviparus]|uniref:Nucleotide-diphospho-sugar transferase domain-containing protein n=1 Tax=Dictyocaulus viviparus TaxID=29172 RepID=A0A0D8XFD9_DICVI|nr:hypothetical protein DICVIV_10634 [Dictyocaulus viviparus]
MLPAFVFNSFIDVAKKIAKAKHLLYFTLVNGDFERLTLNWLCNTSIFKNLHDLVLIVSTSKSLCEHVQWNFGDNLTCIFFNFPGYDEHLDWGKQKYIDFLTMRAQLAMTLIRNSIRFVLIEVDSTWFQDPLELFLNTTVFKDVDILVPSNGYIHRKDLLAFSPMLVKPTNTSLVLFNEINRLLRKNDSLYDQDVLNKLCSVQYGGVICRNFEYSDIADGKWFYLKDKEKVNMHPFIVNNNFYVGVRNKETRQAINGLWFLTKTGHCSTAKVEHSLKKAFHMI